MNRKTYLVKVAYLMDLSDEEYKEMGDQLIPELENEMIVGENLKLDWQSSSTILLNSETMNCGKCFKCNSWVTDREKPDSIDELNNGAVVDNRLLCDECLPEAHRWAF